MPSNVNGREPFFGPPKSQATVRLVPLPSVVADALRAHLHAYPSTTLVFTNNVGAPLRRSAFWTEWNRALKRAGVPAIRFHELRHYYASLLIRHGESVKTVQSRLGDASETLDTYSHLWPTTTSEPGPPSTESSEILRTICGLTGVTNHITTGPRAKSG
jgi:integrase